MLCNTRIFGAVVACVFIGAMTWGQSGVPAGVTGTTSYPVITHEALSEAAIVVQQASGASNAGQASAAKATAPLAGTHWKLFEVGGMPAVAGEGTNEASLELKADGQLAGSSGCNRLVGSYKVRKDSLRFKPAGLTKMACPDSLMKQEEAFIEVLKETTKYRIVGKTLELRDDKDVLARLQARPAA